MNGFILLFGSAFVIFITCASLYWYMRSKYDEAMTMRGRSLSFRESEEKAKEIQEFLEHINTGERLCEKCRKAGIGGGFGASRDAATFLQVVHLLGCEVVIRQVDTKDIEHPKTTDEIVAKHLSWLHSTERYLRRKDEEENGFSQY